MIRFCEYPQKSIWISFLNKPRTSMFKYHNKPGFSMKIVWHYTSKQKEFKEKVIQTCKIFQLKVCYSKWSRSRYFKVERPRTKRCTTGQYEIGHKMLNQILGLLLFLGLILFTWFWKLMCFFFSYSINCDFVCFRPFIATLIRIYECRQKSIWFSFLDKPRTSMFKYHNKPGFAMKIVWHYTSK